MNFKHEKFDDSAVMRSLEKVAREKGWVEVKPITKSASNELNLSPSPNLVDNVMKLCAGLRQAGLERYALDIENKFVAFKQAATLYDTHGETGDDLIDAAHPKGSHKMEGLDNAVFKTILDRHVDMINMIDKKPSGKLSNAKDILRAVKVVLAQAPAAAPASDVSKLEANIRQNMSRLKSSLTKLVSLTESEFTWSLSHRANEVSEWASNPTKANLDNIKKGLAGIREKCRPSWSGGVSEDLWSKIQPLIDLLISLNDKSIEMRVQLNEVASQKLLADEEKPSGSPAAPAVSNVILDKIKGYLRTLSIWTGKIQTDPDNDEDDKKKGIDWINKKVAALVNLKKIFDGLPDDEARTESIPSFQSNLTSITKDFEQFRTTWIG